MGRKRTNKSLISDNGDEQTDFLGAVPVKSYDEDGKHAPPKSKKKKSRKPEDEYGRGQAEICPWMDFDSQWKALSEKKRLGYEAHKAQNKVWIDTREEHLRTGEDPMKILKRRMAEWNKQYGHITGWWKIYSEGID